MKYVGSKARYAREILPIVLKDRYPNQYYVEPFVGGFNMIDKVSGNRIANDKHFYLIELYKAISYGWIPPDAVTESEYIDIKTNKDKYFPALVGFVGFGCSFSGKWFGGYARGSSNGVSRNYCLESKRNIMRQAENINGIQIYCMDYFELEIPKESIIYCDPPYQGTVRYNGIDKFDYQKFWDWCELKSKEGHKVFVSEYNAPSERWQMAWQKTVHNTLDLNTGSKTGTEKLFYLKND